MFFNSVLIYTFVECRCFVLPHFLIQMIGETAVSQFIDIIHTRKDGTLIDVAIVEKIVYTIIFLNNVNVYYQNVETSPVFQAYLRELESQATFETLQTGPNNIRTKCLD